jgi:soluble lytic murein transglycosylase-like protein
VELGCFFLSQLSNEFDDFQKILIAYNAGRGNLIRWSGEGDLLSKTFPETRRYVIKVRRVYWFLKVLHGVQGFY